MRLILVVSRDHTNLRKFGPNNMNCPRKRAFFAAVPLLSFFVVPLLGQEPTPPKPAAPPAAQQPKPVAKQQGPAPIRITTSTVVVPFTAKHRTPNPLPA